MPIPKEILVLVRSGTERPPSGAREPEPCAVQPCPGYPGWSTPPPGPGPDGGEAARPCIVRDRVFLEILDLGPPAPAARRVVGLEQAHARRPADLDGDLSHGAYLLNACAAVQGAP